MKEQNNLLLFVNWFSSWYTKDSDVDRSSIPYGTNDEEIHRLVVEKDNNNFSRSKPKIIYSYSVNDTKGNLIVPSTYVRGDVLTINKTIYCLEKHEFTPDIEKNLSDFILEETSVNIYDNEGKYNLERMLTGLKIALIPGYGVKETFFELVPENTRIQQFFQNSYLALNSIYKNEIIDMD